jgi:hypothetical protein
MSSCVCSVAPAILISPAKSLTNWHPSPPYVFSSDTPLITKATGVSISPPITLSSLDKLFFMRQISPLVAHYFGRTPCGTYDSTRATRGTGIRNSGHTTCDTNIPALPAALPTSPSTCAGATNTASTSAVVTSEGRTGGTSSQPSSDDHTGEAGLAGTG